MSKLPVPSEDSEQEDFIQWLELKGLKFTSIPNHTYNPHFSQQAKNKKLGLRKGLPDVLVLLPTGIAFVEMKRIKGSTTSPEQKAWVEAINNTPGAEARICKGCVEAVAFIEELLHGKEL